LSACGEALRRVSELTGSLVAWLTLPMVLGTLVIVILRYAFDLGWIWMQESVVWIHAAVFMLAAAYTLNRDEHVRVDIFYRDMSPRRKALVNVAGTLLFLLPVSVFLLVVSWDYVAVSWRIHEASREAGGLPYPFVPLLKSVIPMTAFLLILQGAADLISGILTLIQPAGGAPSPPRPVEGP
jgi:TRAP-type mannitol/chloroaromatic compound transport system permease small subunit